MYRQLHIVGCSPRSGTTLLHALMASCFCFDVQYPEERRFNRTTAGRGQTLLSKRPRDTCFMPAVLASVPDFWVLYLLRDPRDVVVSRHRNAGGKYYANFRLWREQHACSRAMQGQERFISVRYEELVTSPDAVQRSIQARIPWLEMTARFSDFHHRASISEQSERAMHGLRPVSADSIGRWRQHLPRIAGQTELHGSIAPELVECGYEADDSWERLLDGVDPDCAAGYYPDQTSLWERARRGPNITLKVAGYRLRRGMASC